MLALVVASSVCNAQSYTEVKAIEGNIDIIPSAYTIDGKTQIVSKGGEYDDVSHVEIYSEELEPLATVDVSSEKGTPYAITQRRKAVIERNDSESIVDTVRLDESMSRDEIIEQFTSMTNYVYTDENGVIYFVNDELHLLVDVELIDENGKYPTEGFILDLSNNLCRFQYEYDINYTGDWVETKNEYSECDLCQILSIGNVTSEGIDGEPTYFTQAVFNDDSKYESLYEIGEIVETNITRYDKDDDGIIDEITTSYSYKPTKVELRQDDGTVLFTYVFEGDEYDIYPYIYSFTTETYLVLRVNSSGDYRYIFYSIDKSGNSIKQVKSLSGMNFTPNPVRSNETLTISLPEATSENVTREVTVTSTSGSIVMKKQVSSDDDSVQLALSGVSGGVYNFTLTENGKVVETSRIIVK